MRHSLAACNSIEIRPTPFQPFPIVNPTLLLSEPASKGYRRASHEERWKDLWQPDGKIFFLARPKKIASQGESKGHRWPRLAGNVVGYCKPEKMKVEKTRRNPFVPGIPERKPLSVFDQRKSWKRGAILSASVKKKRGIPVRNFESAPIEQHLIPLGR